jgi:ABC-type Na+ efflux pump permease subunit
LQRAAAQNPLMLMRKERRYSPEEVVTLLEAAGKSAGKGLVQRDLPTLDDQGQVLEGKEVQSGLRPLVPIFATIILFMVVLIGASPQLQGVIEEKMNRIGEVLLGSAAPFQILSGKLLGMTATGLVLSLVYLGGGLMAARHWNLAGDLRWDLPVWFVVFQILALLLYGSLFVAVGSACSDMKQAQTMLMPVSLSFSLPLMFLMPVMEDPTGSLARAASFFPLATPTLMLCRVAAAPNLPLWEPVLGAAIVLLTTVGAIWMAGRIFRIGYLSTGKAPTLVELTRWIFSRS